LKHKNKNGCWKALHYLCRHYSHNNLIEIAKLVIENGAEVTAEAISFSSIGLTALHLLYVKKGLALMGTIKQHSCPIPTLHLLTSLLIFHAIHVLHSMFSVVTIPAYKTLIDTSELLIKRGVDFKAKKPNEWIALHLFVDTIFNTT